MQSCMYLEASSALIPAKKALTQEGTSPSGTTPINASTRVDAALQMIREKIDERPAVSVTYFVPDERKAGGSYQSAEGIVKRIDPVAGVLLIDDCKAIPLADILDIEIIP